VGVFIVIVIIVVFVILKNRASKAQGGGGATPVNYGGGMPAPMVPSPQQLEATVGPQLADLKTRDPAFSEQQFEDMASTSFFKIQEAWASRDMSKARAFLSPTLYQRFETQVAELKRNGQTNRMESLVIGSLDIVEAVHDGATDYVSVRINAAAADYTLDDKTGAIVSGSKQINNFSEYWTFLRSDKVQTKAGAEIASQKCPNCGAPIQLNAVGKCDYCASDITSGQFSWVLSEITQESVWRPRASSAPRPQNVSPLAGGRYVLGLVQCPNCGANVQDIAGVTDEKCWRCGATVKTEK
jgi:hypothetical protein